MENREWVKFKHDYDKILLYQCHPLLITIVYDLAQFCRQYNYTPTITSTLSDPKIDKKLNRLSSTHRDGRAFDLRVNDMDMRLRKSIKEVFSAKYAKVAAINRYSEPRLIVDKGNHLHWQLNRSYALPIIEDLESVFPINLD